MEAPRNEFLKPALKTKNLKLPSILDNFQLGENSFSRYTNKLLPPSPLTKVNYIKSTRASQILYMKNNKPMEPLMQVEFNTNKFERRSIE